MDTCTGLFQRRLVVSAPARRSSCCEDVPFKRSNPASGWYRRQRQFQDRIFAQALINCRQNQRGVGLNQRAVWRGSGRGALGRWI
jgi:hypothetical protein